MNPEIAQLEKRLEQLKAADYATPAPKIPGAAPEPHYHPENVPCEICQEWTLAQAKKAHEAGP